MLKKHLLVAALIVAMYLVTTSALTSAWAMPINELPRKREEQRAVVVKLIKEHFGSDADVMIAIAECESTGLVHITPDGKLLPNRLGSGAAGVFQLMPVHYNRKHKVDGKTLDVRNNLEDYIKYVRHLYGQQGLQPWISSSGCWSAKAGKGIADQIAKRNQRGTIVEVAEAKN